MILSVLLPLLAQASIFPGVDPGRFDPGLQEPPSVEQDRLTVCLDQVRTDPSTAILTANLWIREGTGPDAAFPNQCLGMAYTRMLRWDAAERAFLAGRDAAVAENHILRARLAAMAGNSALADGRNDAAIADFDLALQDASAASDIVTGGEIQIDRSRALVALGRTQEAAEALAAARRDAPQSPDAWLLSATLSRRADDLQAAQAQIATAAGLDPQNPAVGLEAGVIAALGGNDDAARKSWQSVLATAPGSPEAEIARGYIDQLPPGATEEAGR
jgi:tetratricopeptide (TPR) repeat protein